MTTTYTEKESSRKKYLVPLVVIMLCLVALTGAAYAYSTSVKGNGDIEGKYVALDMYNDEGTSGAHSYKAVADLKVNSKSFTIITERNNTVSTTTSYKAKVVADSLEYYTILHINKSDNVNTTTFYLKTPTYDFTAPETTKVTTTLGLGTLAVKTVHDIDDDADITPTKNEYALNADHYYMVTFTIPYTGDADGVFGTYSNLTDLASDIELYNSTKILVTFTASTEVSN